MTSTRIPPQTTPTSPECCRTRARPPRSRSTYPRHRRRGRPITGPRHRLTSYDTRPGHDATLCGSSCPSGLARTGWEWGRRRRLRRLGARRVVTLCLDLREWYVVFITEGAACATFQVSSVLCPTEWGCVSALSPDLFASCMCCCTC